ncbi:MAG: hypothetical protein F3745_04190, partial [Nitrospinae bacterium]|nr:hypothetical protein [Nitrospinota bacterium]
MNKSLCLVLILFLLPHHAFSEDHSVSDQENLSILNNDKVSVTSDTDFDALFSDEKTVPPAPKKEIETTGSDDELDALFSDEKTVPPAPKKEIETTGSDDELDALFSDEKTVPPAPK